MSFVKPFDKEAARREIAISAAGYQLPAVGALDTDARALDGSRLQPLRHPQLTVRAVGGFVIAPGQVARPGAVLELEEPLANDLIERGLAERA